MPYAQWRQRHFFVSVCSQIYGVMALALAARGEREEHLSTLLVYFLIFVVHIFAIRSPLIRQSSKELFSLSFLLTANSIVVSATGGHIYAHMAFMVIACLVSLYRSSIVAGSIVIFSVLYYMLVGAVSPGLIFTSGLIGKDAFDWSLVLFSGLVLVTALSAVSWLIDNDLNENLIFLESAVASAVLRDRKVNELQDNVLQAITAAMYLIEDEQSPISRSLKSALDDSKKIVTMLRSKELLANEDFVRLYDITNDGDSSADTNENPR